MTDTSSSVPVHSHNPRSGTFKVGGINESGVNSSNNEAYIEHSSSMLGRLCRKQAWFTMRHVAAGRHLLFNDIYFSAARKRTSQGLFSGSSSSSSSSFSSSESGVFQGKSVLPYRKSETNVNVSLTAL